MNEGRTTISPSVKVNAILEAINVNIMGKIIGAVFVFVLLVGGFLYWNSRPKAVVNTPSVDQAAKEMLPAPAEGQGVISSIKEAMGLGQKMQCTYTMNEGGKAFESKVVVDGDKYASTTMIDNMTVYGVFDGENQYSWTSAAKTGTKMSKSCMEKMTAAVKDMSKPAESPTSVTEDMEKVFETAKNVKCEGVTNADFALPKDVTFTDSCALMEQSMEMMKEMKDKLPAGMTMPSMPAAY